jgi:hypothetical protein
VESAGRAGAAGFPVPCGVRFRADDLRLVRRVTARWAVQAGLPTARAEDFVIAVGEIAAKRLAPGGPGEPGGRLRVLAGWTAAGDRGVTSGLEAEIAAGPGPCLAAGAGRRRRDQCRPEHP